jgi:hypothetical protein
MWNLASSEAQMPPAKHLLQSYTRTIIEGILPTPDHCPEIGPGRPEPHATSIHHKILSVVRALSVKHK